MTKWIVSLSCSLLSLSVHAIAEIELRLKDHLFHPSNITVPAGEKVKLIIVNEDNTPEEFDSFDLNREKVLFPNRRSVIYIGPLKPGTYHFFGEFNPNSARGTVTATQGGEPRVD